MLVVDLINKSPPSTKPDDFYSFHKNAPLHHIRNQMNPNYAFMSSFFIMNYLSSFLCLKLKSPKFSLIFNFSTKVICTVLNFLRSAACTSICCIKYNWSKQFLLPYKYRNVCGRNRVGSSTTLMTTLTGLFIIFRRVHVNAKRKYWLRHVCPSVRPYVRMQKLVSHWRNVHKILYFNIFCNICRENSSFIEIRQ